MLVLPHVPSLLAFAQRRDHTNADDLLQETLLRGWQRFSTLRDPAAIRPWLFQILHSLFLGQYRQQKRRQHLLSTAQPPDLPPLQTQPYCEDPLQELINDQSAKAVRKALQDIPKNYAIAIELHDIEGLRYRDIAIITNVAIGTVMSRIARGRRLLAKSLDPSLLHSTSAKDMQ